LKERKKKTVNLKHLRTVDILLQSLGLLVVGNFPLKKSGLKSSRLSRETKKFLANLSLVLIRINI
jgi:hypothetical protein